MKPVFAVSSLVLLVMVGFSTGDDDDARNDIPWGQQQPYMPDQLYQQYGQTSPTNSMDPNMMLMMVMMMNSDSDSMMPLMMMMMTMGDNQNSNMMMPVLIMSMMNKDSPSKSEYKWCYKKDKCAEETWKDEFHTCNGFHQSPIDVIFRGAPVEDASNADNGALTFVGYDTMDNKLKNKGGKTVQIDVSNSAAVLSGGPLGSDYKVLQLHFHWGSDDTQGSEHFYDGQAYPMEVHIVHYKAAYEGDLDKILNNVDGLAVTGFMFSVGAENAALKPITDALASITEPDSYKELATFRLDQLMAPAIVDGMTFATYPGGLTTPPCNEVVTWLNFMQPLTISAAQLQAFRELKDGKGGKIVNNYRSPQPTAGRVPKLYKWNIITIGK